MKISRTGAVAAALLVLVLVPASLRLATAHTPAPWPEPPDGHLAPFRDGLIDKIKAALKLNGVQLERWASMEGELRAALAAPPATQVLRVNAPDLAQWLTPAPGESLDMHLYLVDPMGRWMMRAPPQVEPTKFKRDIDRVLRASASWDTPGR